MANLSSKALSLLVSASPWLIVGGLAYAAAFIRPQVQLQPLPQPLLESRDEFFDAALLNDGSVALVGRQSTVLQWQPQQQQWQRHQLSPRVNLQGIAEHASGRVVAIGNDGRLFSWSVSQWQQGFDAQQVESVELPVADFASKLMAVTAVDDGFWVVGEMGAVFHVSADDLKVTDHKLEQDINLNDVLVDGNGTLWIAAEFGTLLRSDDQAQSWNELAVAEQTLQGLASYQDELWVVGNGGLAAYSADNGESWQRLQLDTQSHLYDVYVSADTALVAGKDSTIFARTNGSWQRQQLSEGSFTFAINSVRVQDRLLLVGSDLLQFSPDAQPSLSKLAVQGAE